jgi:hypothetical protein
MLGSGEPCGVAYGRPRRGRRGHPGSSGKGGPVGVPGIRASVLLHCPFPRLAKRSWLRAVRLSLERRLVRVVLIQEHVGSVPSSRRRLRRVFCGYHSKRRLRRPRRFGREGSRAANHIRGATGCPPSEAGYVGGGARQSSASCVLSRTSRSRTRVRRFRRIASAPTPQAARSRTARCRRSNCWLGVSREGHRTAPSGRLRLAPNQSCACSRTGPKDSPSSALFCSRSMCGASAKDSPDPTGPQSREGLPPPIGSLA